MKCNHSDCIEKLDDLEYTILDEKSRIVQWFKQSMKDLGFSPLVEFSTHDAGHCLDQVFFKSNLKSSAKVMRKCKYYSDHHAIQTIKSLSLV